MPPPARRRGAHGAAAHPGAREYQPHDALGMIECHPARGCRTHRMTHQRCRSDPLCVHEREQIAGEVSLGDAQVGRGPAARGVGKAGRSGAALVERIDMEVWIQAQELRPPSMPTRPRAVVSVCNRISVSPRCRSQIEITHVHAGRQRRPYSAGRTDCRSRKRRRPARPSAGAAAMPSASALNARQNFIHARCLNVVWRRRPHPPRRLDCPSSIARRCRGPRSASSSKPTLSSKPLIFGHAPAVSAASCAPYSMTLMRVAGSGACRAALPASGGAVFDASAFAARGIPRPVGK